MKKTKQGPRAVAQTQESIKTLTEVVKVNGSWSGSSKTSTVANAKIRELIAKL